MRDSIHPSIHRSIVLHKSCRDKVILYLHCFDFFFFSYLWIFQELDKITSSLLLVGRVFGKVTAGLSKEPNGSLFDFFSQSRPNHQVVGWTRRRRIVSSLSCWFLCTACTFLIILIMNDSHQDLTGEFQILFGGNGGFGYQRGCLANRTRGRSKSLNTGSGKAQDGNGKEFHGCCVNLCVFVCVGVCCRGYTSLQHKRGDW